MLQIPLNIQATMARIWHWDNLQLSSDAGGKDTDSTDPSLHEFWYIYSHYFKIIKYYYLRLSVKLL